MLSFFRKNSFFNSIMILVYALILQLIPAVMQIRSEGFHFSFTGSNPVLHLLLLFIQAIFINRLIIENRLHRDIMLFPGVFYILFASMIPAFWSYNHIHIANFFIVWAVFELFQIYKTPNPAAQIFNASFLIGIASNFCPPTIFYLFLIFIGITNLKKMELVHPMQIIIGGFIPWFLRLTYEVWNGTADSILSSWTSHFSNAFFKMDRTYLTYFIVFAVVCLFFFINYNELRKKKHIQAQKKVDILYLSMVTAILIMMFHAPVDPTGFLFAAPFIGIFAGLLISHIKNTAMAELIHFVFFFGILLFQIFTFFKFN